MTGPAPYNGYGQAPAPYPVYVAPRYEPLSRRHRRAALWAGAVGLNILNLGAGVLTAAVVVGAFALLFASISASAGTGSGLQGFDEFLAESSAGLWLLLAGVVGLVIAAVGLLTSVGILSAGGVRRPWAVTWSAFGISVPLLVIGNFIAGFAIQAVSTLTFFAVLAPLFDGGSEPDPGAGATGLVVGLVALVVAVVLVALVGALAWWWMAHAFRERVPVPSAIGTPSPGPGVYGAGYGGAVYGGSAYGGPGYGGVHHGGGGPGDGAGGDGGD